MSELGIYIKFSTNEIICSSGPLEGATTEMINDSIPFKNDKLIEVEVENNNQPIKKVWTEKNQLVQDSIQSTVQYKKLKKIIVPYLKYLNSYLFKLNALSVKSYLAWLF